LSKNTSIYLVARYYKKPRDHVNTSKKGWMDNPDNIRWDEKVGFTRGLKSKDQDAQVILNLSDKVVQRNTFNTGKTFDEIFRYFFENYHQYLLPVMQQIDPDYLQALANKLTEELEEKIPEAVEAVDKTIKAAKVFDAEYEEVQAK
jgi:Ni,Fe-hydrogenase maturation factor